MPITFDFANSGATTSVAGMGTQTLSNIADGVRFTVTSDGGMDGKLIFFGNASSTTAPISLSDSLVDNMFTLRFESTLNTSNTRLDGTAMNPIALQLGNVNGAWDISFLTPGGTVAGSNLTENDDNALIMLPGNTTITGVKFTSANGDPIAAQLVVQSLSGNQLSCFCAGTRIAAVDGSVAVEDLQPGDKLLRADGGETEVKWLGRQFIDTRLTHPDMVNPIRIGAGALGAGLPARDLLVSADHAIGIDGLLVNAGALVNGETIFREPEMPCKGFTYYHIETAAHELLLVEGLPAESFLDSGRWSFENTKERDGTSAAVEMERPRISSARHLPAHIFTRIAPKRAA